MDNRLGQLASVVKSRTARARDMSSTTPRSYYEEFVQPNFQEYLQDPDNIRRAFNASVPAFQLADVMYKFYSEEDTSKISKWPDLKALYIYLGTIEPPAWITIQSVANAYKHLRIRKPQYVIESPGALWSLTLPRDDVDFVPADLSLRNWAPNKDVTVRFRDGMIKVSLANSLSTVVEKIWPSILPSSRHEHLARSSDATTCPQDVGDCARRAGR